MANICQDWLHYKLNDIKHQQKDSPKLLIFDFPVGPNCKANLLMLSSIIDSCIQLNPALTQRFRPWSYIYQNSVLGFLGLIVFPCVCSYLELENAQ